MYQLTLPTWPIRPSAVAKNIEYFDHLCVLNLLTIWRIFGLQSLWFYNKESYCPHTGTGHSNRCRLMLFLTYLPTSATAQSWSLGNFDVTKSLLHSRGPKYFAKRIPTWTNSFHFGNEDFRNLFRQKKFLVSSNFLPSDHYSQSVVKTNKNKKTLSLSAHFSFAFEKFLAATYLRRRESSMTRCWNKK